MSRSAFLLGAVGLTLSSGLSAATVSEIRTVDTSGQPGEVVELHVVASFSDPAYAFSLGLNWDPERLSLLGWSAEGTASQGSDPLKRLWREVRPGAGFLGLRNDCCNSFQLAPGDDVLLANARFQVLAASPSGEALVTPVEFVGNVETLLVMEVPRLAGLLSVSPEGYVGSSVSVTAPSGPRPVGDLSCEQVLDRVHLSFSLTETYDSIAVWRDDREIAVLPGNVTSYEGELEALGRQVYTVTSRSDASESLPASCEVIAQPPAAPTVTDLTCGNGRLTWLNPMPFDRISIFRQGEQVADLDGSAESYDDPEPSPQLTVYTVVSEIGGFRSPETNCFENGLWVLEVGDVEVPVGAGRVLLPIYLSAPGAVNGIEVHLDIDDERFRLVTTEPDLNFQGTVAHPDTEFFATGHAATTGRPAIGIAFDLLPPREPEKHLPAGLRQHVISFVFEPVGTFNDGDTFPVLPHRAEFVDTSSSGVFPNVLIGGEIRFGESVPPVEGLAAEPGGDANTRGGGGEGNASDFVGLSWRNGADYDAVRIERNGVPISEIAGNATTFVDTEVPAGLFTYKVVGVKNNETTFPRSAFLTTVSPPGAFLRGDTTRDGTINLADPMRTLQVLFRGGATFPCEDAADANDDGSLNLTDAVYTLHYLFRGNIIIKSPGTRYPWFDPTPDGLACRD